MRALIQRVSRASVSVNGTASGAIGPGYVVLLGIGRGDTEKDAEWLAAKTAELRLFSNPAGKFDHSLADTGGEALVVSQFTLYGAADKGRRPDFSGAAAPEDARVLYERFVRILGSKGIGVKTGVFAAHMTVEIINDGPVTLWLDSRTEERDR